MISAFAWLVLHGVALMPAQSAGTPLVGILIDLSSSMTAGSIFLGDRHADFVSDVATALTRLASTVKEPGPVRLGTFAQSVKLGPPERIAGLPARLLDLDQKGGPSPLWDSLIEFSSAFPPEAARGSEIIVVTDGVSTGNRYSRDDARTTLVSRGLKVCFIDTVGVPRFGDTDSDSAAEVADILLKFAEATGGSRVPCGKTTRTVRTRCEPLMLAAAMTSCLRSPSTTEAIPEAAR